MSGRLPLSAVRAAARVGPSAVPRTGLAQVRASTRTYATFEGEPKVKRSFLPRFLLWSTGGLTLFYGVSTVVALNNQRYQDWFGETVPFGEEILDYLDTHDVVSEAKSLDYGGIGSQAITGVGHAYGRVSQAAHRLVGAVEEEAHDASDAARRAQKEARAKIIEAKDQARKQVARVTTQAEEKAEEVKGESAGALEKVKAKTADLIERGRSAAQKAEREVQKALPAAAARSESKPAGKTYDRPLPVTHEPPQGYVAPSSGDRKLKAETDPNTRLRPDPQATKLPQLAPALSSLTGSEPMIGQLAGTIDDLAAFLRDTPTSGARAKYVLDEAKDELQRLSQRLDDIRKTEQARAEKSLSSQAKKYEDELKRKAEEQKKRFSALDEEGKKKLDEERRRASADYESRLRTELDTQREIINERLKEEVVAQGVEMQKRWMKEIKRRVEEERGGRLARLDELAGQLGEIEKVTMDNSAALEEGSGAHRTAAAVRALAKVALADASEDSSASPSEGFVKRPYRQELSLLKSTPLAKQSELVKSALEVLESSATADEGVESLASLTSWYVQKVKPRLQQVALLPEQAGLLSHLTSALLSPLLFTKAGNPQGDDVPSVLARAEYALLQRKDLDAAAREINSLKGWPKVLAQDWLNESRRRLEVEQGVGLVQAEASYHSLLNA
ncbi:unnamed protein product [Parajaminaea phylloscopi]